MLISPITARRNELGLTRGGLALLLRCSPGLVGFWERAEARLRAEQIGRLAEVLHRDPEALAAELDVHEKAVRAHLTARVTNAATSLETVKG